MAYLLEFFSVLPNKGMNRCYNSISMSSRIVFLKNNLVINTYEI